MPYVCSAFGLLTCGSHAGIGQDFGSLFSYLRLWGKEPKFYCKPKHSLKTSKSGGLRACRCCPSAQHVTSPKRLGRRNPPCVAWVVERDESVKGRRVVLGCAPRLWAFAQY